MGQRATERFQIENDESEDMELTFRVGEFVGDDERFTPAVTIGPPGHEVVHAADRRVASGERRTFEVAVPVENPFRPGRRYAGTIFVVREGRTVGELTVEVTVEGARRP